MQSRIETYRTSNPSLKLKSTRNQRFLSEHYESIKQGYFGVNEDVQKKEKQRKRTKLVEQLDRIEKLIENKEESAHMDGLEELQEIEDEKKQEKELPEVDLEIAALIQKNKKKIDKLQALSDQEKKLILLISQPDSPPQPTDNTEGNNNVEEIILEKKSYHAYTGHIKKERNKVIKQGYGEEYGKIEEGLNEFQFYYAGFWENGKRKGKCFLISKTKNNEDGDETITVFESDDDECVTRDHKIIFANKGILYSSEGFKYQGGWGDPDPYFLDDKEEAKYRGKGQLDEAEGGVYIGEFKHGKFQGEGTYTQPDGVKLVGKWIGNKKNGEFEIFDSDGTPLFGKKKMKYKNDEEDHT